MTRSRQQSASATLQLRQCSNKNMTPSTRREAVPQTSVQCGMPPDPYLILSGPLWYLVFMCRDMSSNLHRSWQTQRAWPSCGTQERDNERNQHRLHETAFSGAAASLGAVTGCSTECRHCYSLLHCLIHLRNNAKQLCLVCQCAVHVTVMPPVFLQTPDPRQSRCNPSALPWQILRMQLNKVSDWPHICQNHCSGNPMESDAVDAESLAPGGPAAAMAPSRPIMACLRKGLQFLSIYGSMRTHSRWLTQAICSEAYSA